MIASLKASAAGSTWPEGRRSGAGLSEWQEAGNGDKVGIDHPRIALFPGSLVLLYLLVEGLPTDGHVATRD